VSEFTIGKVLLEESNGKHESMTVKNADKENKKQERRIKERSKKKYK